MKHGLRRSAQTLAWRDLSLLAMLRAALSNPCANRPKRPRHPRVEAALRERRPCTSPVCSASALLS